jgi:hypothetical protein
MYSMKPVQQHKSPEIISLRSACIIGGASGMIAWVVISLPFLGYLLLVHQVDEQLVRLVSLSLAFLIVGLGAGAIRSVFGRWMGRTWIASVAEWMVAFYLAELSRSLMVVTMALLGLTSLWIPRELHAWLQGSATLFGPSDNGRLVLFNIVLGGLIAALLEIVIGHRRTRHAPSIRVTAARQTPAEETEPSPDPVDVGASTDPEHSHVVGRRLWIAMSIGAALLTHFLVIRSDLSSDPEIYLTDAMYEAIQPGMGLREVEDILGFRGESVGPDHDHHRVWRNPDWSTTGYQFDVRFRDGKVSKKSRTVPVGAFDMGSIASQLASPDAALREEAFRELSGNHPDQLGAEAAAALTTGLADPVPRVRIAAAWSIQTIGRNHRAHRDLGNSLPYDWPANQPLRAAILAAVEDPNAQVAEVATGALVDLYPPSDDIRDALIREYRDSQDPARKGEIVMAIGDHGYLDPMSLAVLEGARSDGDLNLRHTAAIASLRGRVPGAEDMVRAMMAEERNAAIREDLEFSLQIRR